eukprot:403373437
MKAKRLNYQSLLQSDNSSTNGIQILMKSFQTIDLLQKKFGHLKINVPPTLYATFEPQPLLFTNDPKTGYVNSQSIKVEQVRQFVESCFQQNFGRTSNGKVDNQMIIPITVTKSQNDQSDNAVELDFFTNSAYDRFNRTFQKNDKLNAIIKEVLQRQKEKQNELSNEQQNFNTIQARKLFNNTTTLRKSSYESLSQDNQGLTQTNLLYGKTSHTAYDQFGNYNGIQQSNEIFFAQVRLQEEIDKQFQVNHQFCTLDSEIENMSVMELKPNNYQSVIDQMNILIDLLNRHLKGTVNQVISELVVDFVQDYRDEVIYFLQFKYINCLNLPQDPSFIGKLSPNVQDISVRIQGSEQTELKSMNTTLLKIKKPLRKLYLTKTMFLKNNIFECAGDYCDIDTLVTTNLPQVHQEIIFELQKKKINIQTKKIDGDHFFDNLRLSKNKHLLERKISRNLLTTMFERVRVCTNCYCIYKDLEKYYFRNLYKQKRRIDKIQQLNPLSRKVTFMTYDSDSDSEEDTMRRLNNKSAVPKSKDVDLRDKIDLAVLKMFKQISFPTNKWKYQGKTIRSKQSQNFIDTLSISNTKQTQNGPSSSLKPSKEEIKLNRKI